MTSFANLPPVLLADDDPDDCTLTVEAFRRADLVNPFRCVNSGEKVIEYLRGCLASGDVNCFPALILLDLNMPRMDGREALHEIKTDPDFKRIPVVIWTTSNAEDDMERTRVAGCDGYLTKPTSFGEMIELMRAIGERWLQPGGHAAETKK